MRYFDAFSGYGGFSLAIQRVYGTNRGLDSEGETDVRLECSRPEKRNGSGEPDSLHKRPDGYTIDSESPTCIGFSEIDKYASQIYSKHFPTHKPYGDITKINASELPDFDLFVGGFPCQAFSIAGKRKGFADTRGTLFFDIARILKIKNPKNILLENVKGLLSHDNGNTFKTIISTLDELGYDLQWQVLNSKDFGVPQNRERVFIVGHLGGTRRPEVFPFTGTDKENTGFSGEKRFAITDSGLNRRKQIRSDYLPPLRAGRGADRADTFAVIEKSAIRRLTPTECERLMGLPDGWTEGVSDTKRYKLCGNGVVVNVVEEIIKRLL